MTRTYRFPSRLDGTTLHFITDTHFGAMEKKAKLDRWFDKIEADSAWLASHIDGHVHAGDMANWSSADDVFAEDDKYVRWRDAIKVLDGKPWAEAVGNHDLGGANQSEWRYAHDAADPGNDAGMSPTWATAVGVSGPNTAQDMGHLRVVTLGPDKWGYDAAGREGFYLPPATIQWFEQEVTTATRPVVVVCHVPLWEHMEWGDEKNRANHPNMSHSAELTRILAENSNVIAWLSGHLHKDQNDTNAVSRMPVVSGASSNTMVHINGPSGGGGFDYDSADPRPRGDAHAQDGEARSLYVTFLEDNVTVEVRERDHLAHTWATLDNGVGVRVNP